MGRSRRYSRRRISRILRKYDLVDQMLELGPGHNLRIVAVDDAYRLLDHMIEQEARSSRRVERFPYWAEVWPAAVGLARWFCASAEAPQPRTALELGCGLGVVGIVMAQLGWRVEATDFVEDALVFAARNASFNQTGARHRVGYLDWRNPVGAAVPCIVASDVIYERKNHPYLARVLRALLQPGGWFYTSDPGRTSARFFIRLMADQGYDHTRFRVDLQWKSIMHAVDIHAFRKPSRTEQPRQSRAVPGCGYQRLSPGR